MRETVSDLPNSTNFALCSYAAERSLGWATWASLTLSSVVFASIRRSSHQLAYQAALRTYVVLKNGCRLCYPLGARRHAQVNLRAHRPFRGRFWLP